MSDRSKRAVRTGHESANFISTVAALVRRPAERGRRRPAALALALGLALATAASVVAADATGGRQSPPAAAKENARVIKASSFSFGRQVLDAEIPVIVDFWAPWCVVCHELDGPLAAVAAKFAGRVRVVRVNVDWSWHVAGRYRVQNLPTILVFKRGEVVSRSVGGASQQDLEEMLAAELPK